MAAQREWYEKDYYAVLGVAQTAEPKEITKAYRKLARENHPDAKPGDDAAEERFKAISTAYDVLSVNMTKYVDSARWAVEAWADRASLPEAIRAHLKTCSACFQVVGLAVAQAVVSVRAVVPILKQRSHLTSMMQFWV